LLIQATTSYIIQQVGNLLLDAYQKTSESTRSRVFPPRRLCVADHLQG